LKPTLELYENHMVNSNPPFKDVESLKQFKEFEMKNDFFKFVKQFDACEKHSKLSKNNSYLLSFHCVDLFGCFWCVVAKIIRHIRQEAFFGLIFFLFLITIEPLLDQDTSSNT